MKLAFRLLDHCLTIDDDFAGRGDELERLFSGLSPTAPFDPRIDFQIHHRDGLDYVSQDDRFRFKVGPERLVSTLMQYLVYRWAESRTWMVIHGAQLIVNDTAVLIVGASGAGKSTLSTVLSLRGFSLGSDELVIVDQDGCVHPYPVPPRIRESSRARVESMGLELWPQPVWMKNEWTYFGLPKTYAKPKPYPVAAVVFLSAGSSSSPTLTSVRPADAAFRLLTEVLNHEPMESQWFETAVDLSLGRPCVDLQRGDGEQTVAALLDYLAAEGVAP